MDWEIVCSNGGRKFILFDKFGCRDEGVYIGEVSGDTIAQMPKVN